MSIIVTIKRTPFIPSFPSNELQKIIPSDGASTDKFGWSLSMTDDGTSMIVGSYDHSGVGAAYFYTNEGGSPIWQEQQKVFASNAGSVDDFGYSVSISNDGNTAVVGAPDEDTGGSNRGSAYIFTKNGGVWSEQQKIQGIGLTNGANFGYSTAISSDGNTIIVGALNNDTGGDNSSGTAYVFTRSGSPETWTQQQQLSAGGGSTLFEFGHAVALSRDGDTAFITAINFYTPGANAGNVYIYTRSGGTWTKQQEIQSNDIAGGDDFGYALDLSSNGNTAVISAIQGENSGNGAVYIFKKSGGTWSQQQKLTASDGASGDQFGSSVSISSDGNTLLVGAQEEDTGGTSSGAAYIFTKIGDTWAQREKYTHSDTSSFDRLGTAVALKSDGSTGMVGAGDHVTGAVYYIVS